MRTAANTSGSLRRGHAIDVLAAGCAVAFIVVLALSAYWDRTIRVLHVFESIPYTLTAVLCLRQRKWGYVLGAASGAFWLWMAGTLTTFVRNGFDRVAMLLRTGHVDRPDILMRSRRPPPPLVWCSSRCGAIPAHETNRGVTWVSLSSSRVQLPGSSSPFSPRSPLSTSACSVASSTDNARTVPRDIRRRVA